MLLYNAVTETDKSEPERRKEKVNQLNESQMRLLVRGIMPQLYRMQERADSRGAPRGGIYDMDRSEDVTAVVRRLDPAFSSPSKEKAS